MLEGSNEGLEEKLLSAIGFRDKGERRKKIVDLALLFSVSSDNFSEMLAVVIDKVHEKLILTKVSTPESDIQKLLEKDLACPNRVFYSNRYHCVTRPPRMVKIFQFPLLGIFPCTAKAFAVGFAIKGDPFNSRYWDFVSASDFENRTKRYPTCQRNEHCKSS